MQTQFTYSLVTDKFATSYMKFICIVIVFFDNCECSLAKDHINIQLGSADVFYAGTGTISFIIVVSAGDIFSLCTYL